MKQETLEQPQERLQAALDDIMEQTPEEYTFRGKKHKMGWLSNMTVRKITHIMLREKDEHKRNMKICAVLRVNDIFAWFRPIVYMVKWRWYTYVADLTDVEALRVVNASKKKVPLAASLIITILATAMMDTKMSMTKKEADAIQAAQAGEQPTQ